MGHDGWKLCIGIRHEQLGALSSILYFVLLLGLVILVYLWIAKLWKETRRKK
ncbi:hypothetical protein HYU19_03580 [Candidatus Woesearchaeota archaeon]|nr:hypothetical protein [Candidatus Woesearchaeota archaeon]